MVAYKGIEAMALLTELVSAIAAVEGLEESFVSGVARYLREAGLISQAGRGRGAAKMQYSDAAALLIGVNATTLAKDAPSVVKEVGSFLWEDQRISRYTFTAQELKDKSDELFDWILQRYEGGMGGVYSGNLHTFLERLIYSAVPLSSSGESRLSNAVDNDDVYFVLKFYKPSFRVEFQFSYYSETIEDEEVVNVDGDIYEHGEFVPPEGKSYPRGDRLDRISITHKTILEVGRVLAS